MSWMELPVGKYHVMAAPHTLSYNQTEVGIRHEDIIFHAPDSGEQWNKLLPLRILSTDIETRVRPDGQFVDYSQTAPLAIIQIGNLLEIEVNDMCLCPSLFLGTHRCAGQKRTFRNIFTLKGCTAIPGAEVRSFDDEASMLMVWSKFIVESDPDLITGFNTACFDFVYLILRAEALGLPDFACLGRLKGVKATALRMRYRDPRHGPVLVGRLQIDIYQYIKERFVGMANRSSRHAGGYHEG
ncbi:ribonuclease H-like domain-containing protein [Mycena maculata]|uniref:DNA polymerase delta catalytic subunit n=1 Tax=Mycena maculata TaxID=230809 RepID=A0AAD7IXJ1_9AGAR|nr:ribonuclease H-like domain-containing protein [Mycena maculata]